MNTYSQYKYSGVETIGDIPKEWSCLKVSRIIEKSDNGIMVGPFGSSLTNAVVGHEDGAAKIYGQANLIRRDFSFGDKYVSQEKYNELKHYEVVPGDIVVSMMGTIGKCRVVPLGIKPGIMDSHLIKLRLGDKVSPYFFEYAYESLAVFNQIMALSKGSIMTGLNSAIVKGLFLAVPPLDEQNAIVDYLDNAVGQIEHIIDEAKTSIDEYKKLKASIIYEAVTKGIDSEAEMVDSGITWIGKMPRSWYVCMAKNVVNISHGSDPKTEGDIPVYGSGAGSFKTCGEYKEGPAVLIGRKGATLHIPHYIEGKYWNVDTAFDVKPKTASYDLKYYYYLATCFDYKYYISQTTLPSMTQSDYNGMRLPVPSIEEQMKIVDYLDQKCISIDSIIAEKEALIFDLDTYKKSLIFEVVTGKRKVC